MRYLNKIIFINSAHTPYAEIKLDGNVHFIGTQGVGKSTLLRAILFFYNADKSKLGIQREQKGFDEFYFGHPDSYVIYEVKRENGSFFVMTFQSQGRAAFRFVDSPYDRRAFVNDDGSVNYEWGKMSQLIGTNVYKSSIVRSYESYRDIIYGNKQTVPRELQRFCIMESAKYQNVPRTIQNIFLNQSLESRVIKDTIINSMEFGDDCIDLTFYREHVKNFRQQYEDIWKWYKKEKNGKVKVQADADDVISKYALYETTRKAIVELCGQLNYAIDRDKEEIPILDNDIEKARHDLDNRKRLLDEESDKYKDERDKLNQQFGVLKELLNKIKAKKVHYNEIGIEDIIRRINHEGELKIRQGSLTQQVSTLTDKNQSVKTKYDSLKQNADNSMRQFKLEAQQRMSVLRQEENTTIGKMQDDYLAQMSHVNRSYKEKTDDVDERIATNQSERNNLKLQTLKIKQMNPYKKELDEDSAKIGQLRKQLVQMQLDSASKQREIERTMNDVALKRKDLDAEANQDIARIENDIASVKDDIKRFQNLLDRQSGSLIEWLGRNVNGWEDNIGKVLDEDNVLYNTTLNPTYTSSENSVYGVSINLENIEKTISTPLEITRKKSECEAEVKHLNNDIITRKQKLLADVGELERKPNTRIKALRQEKFEVDAEIQSIPQRIDSTQKSIDLFHDKLEAYRERELEKNHTDLMQVESCIDRLNNERSDIQDNNKRGVEKISKDFEHDKKAVHKDFSERLKTIENEINVKTSETETKKREIDAQMDCELKGLGVNVNQLNAIRTQLQSVEAELDYIDRHKKDLFSWQKDKEEFLDREQETTDKRKSLKQKIDDVQDKFLMRRQKLDDAVKSLSDNLHGYINRKQMLVKAVENTENFINASSCPAELKNAEKIETVKLLDAILNSLRDTVMDQQRRMNEFKESINKFKLNFSAQNTFHFRTEFNEDSDYIEFAANLNDFLSNKKIEEYRLRVSENYAGILIRISREVSDLMNHNSQIQSTIGDINKDFKENNFAGVIKDIELRSVESSDKLMQLLLSIKQYNEEHNFDIGEMNLFSSQDNLSKTNEQAVKLLMTLMDQLDVERKRDTITLTDTFKLEFKVKENDNDTGWVEKLSNVGSDGTDILVKAMVNIMLINVFKRKVSRKFGDFRLHCMMDEIGKLHPDNVKGILDFGNKRNIYLINSSPTTYNAETYKYTYFLSKDARSNTVVKTLLTIK